MSEPNQPRKRECPECGGSGGRFWSDVGMDHGPNCDGFTCKEPCPVPIEIPREEPCDICGGTGTVEEKPDARD